MAAARIIHLEEIELAAHRRRGPGVPLSGGDRKALAKELHRSSVVHGLLQTPSVEARARGEALVREADKLACESFNERLWSLGGPLQPSPTIAQAINGGFPFLEVRCTRCRADRTVDMRTLRLPLDRDIWKLEASLRCDACEERHYRPPAVIRQVAPRPRLAE